MPDMSPASSPSWQFRNPVHIHFGAGCRSALAPLVRGGRLLAVTSRRGKLQFLADPVLSSLAPACITWMDSVSSNPGLADIQIEIERLAGQKFDAIIAFGGGSAMDAAKALAAALAPGLATRDLATLIAAPAEHLDRPLLPLHAVSTTSGTGAEVTPFATIWDHKNRRKLSLASPRLFPVTAFVDPDLTMGLPRDVTVSTGLDALNQAFESLWNKNSTPLSLAFASRAVGLALSALPRLDTAPQNALAARADMAEASLLAGMAISQTRTALCHSISYPLTAHFGLAHGWACAVTMQAVAELAFAAEPALFEDVARNAGLMSAYNLLERLRELLESLGVKAMSRGALPDLDQIIPLIPQMFTPGRSDNFILPITPGLLEKILRDSL